MFPNICQLATDKYTQIIGEGGVNVEFFKKEEWESRNKRIFHLIINTLLGQRKSCWVDKCQTVKPYGKKDHLRPIFWTQIYRGNIERFLPSEKCRNEWWMAFEFWKSHKSGNIFQENCILDKNYPKFWKNCHWPLNSGKMLDESEH